MIGLKGGHNTFGYGFGSPIRHSDPLGLDPPGGAVDFMNALRDLFGPMPNKDFRRDGLPQGAGCGDRSFDWIVPDMFPESCTAHDDCYGDQCGKEFCDAKFHQDMMKERPEMSLAPWAYYFAVDRWGDDAYATAGKKR